MSCVLALTEKDSGKTFRVNVGDLITISLEENRSTGSYHWKDDSGGGPKCFIQYLEGRYTQRKPARPGIGGVIVFVYQINDAETKEGVIKLNLLDPTGEVQKTITFNMQHILLVNVIVVVDALGAATSDNLANNVYLIDSRKYMGSWKEGQCELHTVCTDSDIIQWRIASVDPGADVKIAGFTGQMINDRICVPTEQGLAGDRYWEGIVEAQGATGRQQYSLVVKIDNKSMTFDPFLEINKCIVEG